MDSLFYNTKWTYEKNFEKGPVGISKLKRPIFKKIRPKFKFLNFEINVPFGIPAGPLLNSKFIKAAFDFGFSLCTYKTVRSDHFPCHPFPNVVYVDAPEKLDPLKIKSLKLKNKPKDPKRISITNSFGVPSKDPEIWQKDLKQALKYETEGKLLILGFMGTIKKGQTQQQFINDFARTADLAKQTGVKAIEVNLSCPNLEKEGLVCYDLKTTEKICKSIRKAIGNAPLIVKVGYFNRDKDIEVVAKITNEYASAIAAINTMQFSIVDEEGKQALPGSNRLKSGVGGYAIKWAGLEMVSKLSKIRSKNGYKFEIVGIGGVTNVNDYFEYRKAGAEAVQSATGAMWNPYLASEIWKKENV
ncbi:MAG: pyr dihydroorotate dehydrogenase [uncultured bacterium]|nr:MAG: pyr dihydroorotate dehydrogenase [uncultured bacterium]OGH13054.1 MAG: hypothetical protein A2687_04265 [Candidatus Levybacteria bacterium RIFCSPHIGHO2_01_FULL_38_26]